MTGAIPAPVDAEAFLASVPTADEFVGDESYDGLRAFFRERIDALGLGEDLARLFDRDAVEEHIKSLTICYTSSAGAEVGNEYVVLFCEQVMAIFHGEDRRLVRLLCEATLHPDAKKLFREGIRMSMVAPLRMPAEPLTTEIVGLVQAVADKAGPREREVHQAFCGLGASWHKEASHNNALIAVFESVETESEAVVIASRLLKMSVLYETRLKPFILTLDDAMVAAGFFKEDKRRTVGKSLKRIHETISSELPRYSDLLDPTWVSLRNAALHGEVRRSPGFTNGLVTSEKPASPPWTLESTEAKLARMEDLVAPLGAIPQAVSIIASRFTLRFRQAVEDDMAAKYETCALWAQQWLGNHVPPGGSST